MAERVYSNPKRVYFDMDGVLADFEKEAIKRGITFKELKNLKGAYRNLPIIEGAKDAVARFINAGYEIFVLTKTPSKNPYSATEKVLWIGELFPEFGDHIIISPDKGAFGKEGQILIDDHPEWANAHNFATNGGKVIKFTGDWFYVFEQAGV